VHFNHLEGHSSVHCDEEEGEEEDETSEIDYQNIEHLIEEESQEVYEDESKLLLMSNRESAMVYMDTPVLQEQEIKHVLKSLPLTQECLETDEES